MRTFMNCASALYSAGGQEHLVVVIDVSVSMDEDDFEPTRLHAAIDAACGLVEVKRGCHGDDRVGIVAFSGVSRSVHALSAARNSARSLKRSIQSLRTDVCTDIGAGLREAASMLGRRAHGLAGRTILGRIQRWLLGGSEAARASTESASKERIILLSDGGDTTGSGPRSVADSLKGRGVVIDTIGIGGSPSGVDEQLLREIATARPDGSKRYWFIKDSEQLVRKFETLAGRLRPLEA